MIDEVIRFIEECSEKDLYHIRRVSQNRINSLNKSKKSTTSIVRRSEFSIEMASTLWASVKVNFPIVKEPDINDWAYNIELLERVDKVPPDLIRAVLLWSQTDSFWKNNIRSTSALRRNFVKVLASAKQKKDFRDQQGGRVYKV